MYNEIDANKPTCKKYLEKAKEFVAKYNELNNVSDITEDSPYYKLLSRLSNDYNNFKNYWSALVNKLIIVLSILVAIPICLGISYKVTADAGEDVEKEERSSIAGGIASWYNHSGSQFGSTSEKWT
ncbi:Plasmodium variant antigen protein Cir/Yir/Bir, putative [Plasmodium berghei]|uniref:Plasmodium variant antigen protein Cir/Yir/Bir, putative n=1 Tax=Plasmodium berghei TaxID=5821 RepID=A0A0Y9Q159_PLABE|nr:Plasmodium variant antigen protein Cir/Yir/Bir, putative [Plasmodium berghei]